MLLRLGRDKGDAVSDIRYYQERVKRWRLEARFFAILLPIAMILSCAAGIWVTETLDQQHESTPSLGASSCVVLPKP